MYLELTVSTICLILLDLATGGLFFKYIYIFFWYQILGISAVPAAVSIAETPGARAGDADASRAAETRATDATSAVYCPLTRPADDAGRNASPTPGGNAPTPWSWSDAAWTVFTTTTGKDKEVYIWCAIIVSWEKRKQFSDPFCIQLNNFRVKMMECTIEQYLVQSYFLEQ